MAGGEEDDDNADDASAGASARAEVGADIRARFEEIRVHEQAHVDAVVQTIAELDGEAAGESECDVSNAFAHVNAFIETAAALENIEVAAYAGAAVFVQVEAVVTAALSSHSLEARHAGYCTSLLGESPFVNAFDDAMTRADVMAEVEVNVTADADATVEAEADVDAEATVASQSASSHTAGAKSTHPWLACVDLRLEPKRRPRVPLASPIE